MKLLERIFSIDTKSTNRIIVYFFGFRFRHLKSGIKKEGMKYIELDCPVTEIPKATGLLRNIQLADLKLLEIFDKICKDNGFEYWLDFGNLLGAVRHKGFIPWDDDVDVSMLREDYERFLELFKDGIPGYEDLYLTFNNNGLNKCFVKVLHKKLSNIQIDIFPYDFYYKKTDEIEKSKLTKFVKRIRSRFIYKILQPFFINSPKKMRKRFAKIRNKSILKMNYVNKNEKPSLFYGIDYPHVHPNHFFDYETIFPLGKISYEGKEFPCPNKPEAVLTQIFGDYMQLPHNCYPRHANSSNNDLEDEMKKFIGDK